MSRYCRHPAVVATELSGEVVALHLDTKRYYTLNATASQVWQALEQGADAGELTDALTSAFDVSTEEARTHVDDLLRQFLEMQLVQPCDD